MSNIQPNTRRLSSDQWLALVFSIPWLEVLAEAYKLTCKLWQGLADESMYEVLEHECTLEMLDCQGERTCAPG
jgi:hypothetical protein